MMKHGYFTFHIVDMSPWPLYMSTGIWMMMMSALCWFNGSSSWWLITFTFSVLSFYGWLRDVVNEGFLQGNHTILVQKGLKMGMVLFIISEVFFFISFFWALFYCSITPSVELYSWPPVGISPVDPMGVVLVGTLLLVSSGVSITCSHHSVLENKKTQGLYYLSDTILLGILFSVLQLGEYQESSFTIMDSIFGSVFYMSTGFHGIHVIIGTLMLSVCLVRLWKNQFSKNHHVGFEAAIWYWHFVDVVWLFLYLSAYWWGVSA